MLLWQTEPHFKDQLRPEICCEVKLFLHMADWHVARTFCSSRVKFSSLRCAWKYCIQVNDLTWIGQCWYQIGSICSAQHQWCLCLLENTAVNLISLQIMSNECVGVSCILANVSEHETVLFILWGLIVQKWANTKVNSPLNTSGKVLELLCSRQAVFPLLSLTASVCHRPLLFFFYNLYRIPVTLRNCCPLSAVTFFGHLLSGYSCFEVLLLLSFYKLRLIARPFLTHLHPS